MRCRQCEYRLWNLTTRQCPECGTPFRPSDYEFAPNSVQFCCPHCQQTYFGTGPKGHLVPAAFNCVRCLRPINIDEMVLLPTAGVEEEQTQAERMPWLDRRKRGTIRAWLATVGAALIRPGQLIRSVPMDGGAGAAWWFAILTNALVALIGIAPIILVGASFGFLAAAGGRGGAGTGPGGGAAIAGFTAGMGFLFIISIVGVAVLVLVWALLAHALLRLTGHTAGGLNRTVQAIGYSAGANALSGIPCIGAYFGWIWWIVSAVLMVREGQRVHGGRAAFAVITLPALVLAGVIGFYVWVFTSAMPAAMRTARSQTSAAVTRLNAQTVMSAIQAYQSQNGRLPRHALELVMLDTVSHTAFGLPNTSTSSQDVPVGDITLNDFAGLDQYEAQELVEVIAGRLPEGICAHRLGDFVFTWHGVDASAADPKLWLVIVSPDPVINGQPAPDDHLAVGMVDGTVSEWPLDQLPAELAAQNTLRAQFGLGPLPDPATVTHARPAACR